MQLTNVPIPNSNAQRKATTDETWNWQNNIITGMTIVASYTAYADSYWLASTKAVTAYANTIPPPTPSLQNDVGIGIDQEGRCIFDPKLTGRTAPNYSHAYADAIMLKKYNSATITHNYVGFNVPYNPATPLQNGMYPQFIWTQPGSPGGWSYGSPIPHVWYMQQFNGQGKNYVAATCHQGN